MPQTGTLILLLFILLVAAILLVTLQLTRLEYLVPTSIPDRPRLRIFNRVVSRDDPYATAMASSFREALASLVWS